MNKTNFNKKKRVFVGSVNNNNNRILIIGVTKCGKTSLMNHIPFQKQEPIFIITKSLNHYPNITAQTPDEYHPLKRYKNSTVVFDYT